MSGNPEEQPFTTLASWVPQQTAFLLAVVGSSTFFYSQHHPQCDAPSCKQDYNGLFFGGEKRLTMLDTQQLHCMNYQYNTKTTLKGFFIQYAETRTSLSPRTFYSRSVSQQVHLCNVLLPLTACTHWLGVLLTL